MLHGKSAYPCTIAILKKEPETIMKVHFTSQVAIDTLVEGACGPSTTARQKHIHREALLSIARLAVVEHVMTMKKDVDKSIGAVDAWEHAIAY
jgi:hypothetical protein